MQDWVRNASAITSGIGVPRASILAMIWVQDFASRKYCCGTPPVSKIADNKDAPAGLGDAKMLRVQDVPAIPVPEPAHLPDKGGEVPASVRGERFGDVFPYEPSGLEHPRDFKEPECEPPSCVSKPLPPSGLREGLARRAADEDVDFVLFEFWLFMDVICIS